MGYMIDWVSLNNVEDIKKYLEVRNTLPNTILGIRGQDDGEGYLGNYELGIYIPDSPEYDEVEQACWEIANDGYSCQIDVPKMRAREVKVIEIVGTILNLPKKIEDVFNS